MSKSDFANHFIHQNVDEVKKITAPLLNDSGVQLISYSCTYNDGSYIGLTSDKDWDPSIADGKVDVTNPDGSSVELFFATE